MQRKVYSQSLKKIKKYHPFELSIEEMDKMKEEIKKQALKIKQKPSSITNYVKIRKQMLSHKISKNNLEEQVDNLMRNLINSKQIEIDNQRIHKRHNYKHYRISTQTVQDLSNRKSTKRLKTVQKEDNIDEKQKLKRKSERILPRILKSSSNIGLQKSKIQKLKTENELIHRLYQDPKQRILEYINLDNAIKHYRAGMTSLIKGVYSNPHNPYNKILSD